MQKYLPGRRKLPPSAAKMGYFCYDVVDVRPEMMLSSGLRNRLSGQGNGRNSGMMRRTTSLACCIGTLLSLLIVAGAAQAQDWTSLEEPLRAVEQAQVQEPAHVLIFTETTQFRHTEAIEQGTPLIRAALEQADITSEHTENSAIFNDVDLARFDALVMFQASGDPWTAEEKAAMERYQKAGGGIVAIHNAADMRGNYEWWDKLIGSLMPGHAATATSPGLPAEVIVEDRAHPSTTHL